MHAPQPLPALDTGTQVRFLVMPVAVSAADLPVLLVHASAGETGRITGPAGPGCYWVQPDRGGHAFEVSGCELERVAPRA